VGELLGSDWVRRVQVVFTDGDSEEITMLKLTIESFVSMYRQSNQDNLGLCTHYATHKRCMYHVIYKSFDAYGPKKIKATGTKARSSDAWRKFDELIDNIRSWMYSWACPGGCETEEEWFISYKLLCIYLSRHNDDLATVIRMNNGLVVYGGDNICVKPTQTQDTTMGPFTQDIYSKNNEYSDENEPMGNVNDDDVVSLSTENVSANQKENFDTDIPILKGYYYELIHSLESLNPTRRQKHIDNAKEALMALICDVKAEKNIIQTNTTSGNSGIQSTGIIHSQRMVQISKKHRR
jgi:hypothetical protein